MRHLVILSAAVLACAVACSPRQPVNVDDLATYSKGMLSFQYPAAWALSSESVAGDGQLLYVEDDESAITTVLLMPTPPGQITVDLKAFAENWSADAVAALEDEPLGEIVDTVIGELEPTDVPALGARLEETFAMVLLGERIDHTRTYVRSPPCGAMTAVLVHQAADEDLEFVRDGFAVITATLALDETASAGASVGGAGETDEG